MYVQTNTENATTRNVIGYIEGAVEPGISENELDFFSVKSHPIKFYCMSTFFAFSLENFS